MYWSRVACSEKISAEGITAEVHSLLKVQHTTKETLHKYSSFILWKAISVFLHVQEVWISLKMSGEKNSETVGCNASIMKNVWEIREREYSQKLNKEQERIEKSALLS